MDKKTVNKMIPQAYQVLSEQGTLDKELKGYIATFGAAVTMGSLPAAVAFYSSSGSSAGREKLSEYLFKMVKMNDKTTTEKNLFEYVISKRDAQEVKELVLNAAIALKLALNLFQK